MMSALQNSSHGPHWDVLIGHLLGIDHCGHTYGPGHIEMRRKLRELDEFIKKLVTLLHPDDLLLVLGDHGMTVSGDHGGDSYAELDAALLLYSGRGFSQFINNTTSRKSSIAQIDLVPTLAALTGVPVPYSNLGVCVDDFLGSSSEVRRALLLNFVQVLNYTLSYHREIGFIPMESDLEQFVDSLSHIADADLFTFAQRLENEQLKSRLQQLQTAFRNHWTRFDSGRMWIGLWLMLSGIGALIHFDSCWGKKELVIIGQNFAAICTLLDIGTSFTTSIFGRLMFASVSTLVLCSSLLECCVSFRSHVPLLLACLHGASYLSNSFLVHEIRVTCFLLHTLIICYTFKRILKIETLFSNWRACCIPLALMFGIRLSVVFEVCREESFSTSNCRSAVDPWLAKPLTKLTLEEARLNGTFRLFLAFGTLLFVIVSHQLWLKHLTKGTVRCVYLQYILPLAGFFLAVCWILDLAQVFVIQSSNNSIHWIRTCFSRALLLSITVVFARLSWSPLLVESIENSKVMHPNVPKLHSPHQTLSEVNTTSEFYSDVKPINTLAGLASIYSSWTGTTLILLPVLASMVFLNEVHIFPLIAIPVTFAMLSYFIQDFAKQANDDEDNLLARHLSQASSWQIAIASSLSDNLSFYITGHQATIVGIPWDAAYAAYSGIHATHWLPALMVVVHLYAGSILVASSLPLFVILATPKNGLWTRTDRCRCSTEFALCTLDPKSVQFNYAFDRLAWRFFTCKAIVLSLSV
ncbi:hypothetical protein PHET_05921 [Paragonimus heterotremus]|uniref:GPI ethanolamine phosphate transferase 3 n=1 Tax=Paragonimus heterotremus TaxID=100268 RepID=A0A8J4TGR1_9TREM|nr:hypothetical protein PHET_05921 [Paragonimus heterotremus]